MNRLIIVGANVAGLSAARGARAAGFEGTITLIDSDRDALLERPEFSKGLLSTAAIPPPMISSAQAAELDLELLLGETVTALCPEQPAVKTGASGTFEGDAVILCTGAASRRLPMLEGLRGRCFTLRSLSDALALRQRLLECRRVAVIGGGLIGLEVAASARALSREVVLIEAQPVVARRAFGDACGKALARLHAGHGVEVRQNVAIVEAVRNGAEIGLSLSDGGRVEADIAIAALGAVPREALAVQAGIASRDGILVDAFGRTSLPGYFAAGDAARIERETGSLRYENLQHAALHGETVGRAAVGLLEPYDAVPWYWSDQYGHSIQACGVIDGTPSIVRDDASGLLAVWMSGGLLTGAVGIDQSSEIAAAKRLIARALPLDPAAVHGGASLKSLARAPAQQARA